MSSSETNPTLIINAIDAEGRGGSGVLQTIHRVTHGIPHSGQAASIANPRRLYAFDVRRIDGLRNLSRPTCRQHPPHRRLSRSTIEKPILNGEGSVDVALEKASRSIACLVSVTTDEKWELGSVRKSLSAGFNFVVLVAADEKHLAKLRRPIEAELSAEEKQRVRFFTPEELFAFIQEQDVAEMQKERTVRGYKIKSNYRPVNGADNSVRQEKISKTVAKSISRAKKKK